MKKHKHTWENTIKWVTKKGGFLGLFTKIYKANIAECTKCGERYYITIP